MKQFGVTGVGYVFSDDEMCSGVDLDDCRDPETGVVADWAKAIISELCSYTEVSPSCTGVKIWVVWEAGRGYPQPTRLRGRAGRNLLARPVFHVHRASASPRRHPPSNAGNRSWWLSTSGFLPARPNQSRTVMRNRSGTVSAMTNYCNARELPPTDRNSRGCLMAVGTLIIHPHRRRIWRCVVT